MVDAVVRAVLAYVCGPQETQHGLCWMTGKRNLVFYVDDKHKARRESYWVQNALLVTVEMFGRVCLKKKRITQRIWFAHQASYGGRSERRRISGEQQRGEKFWERKRKMVSCSVCGETVVASSIRNPMELSYGVIPQQMQ